MDPTTPPLFTFRGETPNPQNPSPPILLPAAGTPLGCSGLRQLRGHGQRRQSLSCHPAQDRPQQVPLPRIHPELSQGLGTHTLHGAGREGGGLAAWGKSQLPTEPWKLCSQQGRGCQGFRAKLSRLFGAGEMLGAPERKTLHCGKKSRLKKKLLSVLLSQIKVKWEEILGLEKAREPSMAKSEFQLSSALPAHPSRGNMTKIMQLLK